MSRRLAIAFAVLGVLTAGPAYALTGDEVCDDADEVNAASVLASIASASAPAATPAPAATLVYAPVNPIDAADLCRGDRLTDDASCWPRSPIGAPHSAGFAGLGGPDVSLIASASVPGPESSLASLPAPAAGAEHPGYARGIDRPPRSF